MAEGGDAAPPMDATGDGERASLTDALPTEMVCRIVSLFRARPGDWMALLLTSRAMAAACRATLDPASDRVHCGAGGAGPTLAARLVDRYAKDVPAVLDAYRCANASALLVEACRAGDLALTRTLLDGRDRWRVDVSYRHNRPLLECVRLNSAIGVQMLLATGRADPVDHPGAAHLGRCALHQEPACRRPDHPALCDACARGQPGGPWSDSDDDDDDDHGNDDDGPDDAHGGTYLDDYDDDPLADTDEDDEDDEDDNVGDDDDRGPPTTGQEYVDDGDVRVAPVGSGPAPTATVPAAHSHDGDGDFEVDYDALFDGEDGGGDDRDYEPHASVYASLVDDDEDEDEDDIAESRSSHRDRDRGDDGDDGEDDDGPESGEDKEVGGMGLWTGNRDDLDATADVRNDDDGWGDEPRHEAVAWEGAADPTTAPAHVLPAGSSGGHALAVRRADLARCVCRRGMTFAIVWIDDEGREIGGRAQGPASEPLWFLVCEDPTALVADGPLSFLTAHAHPPSRPAVPLWYGDDHLSANSADDTGDDGNNDHNGSCGGRAIDMFAMGQGAAGDRDRDANLDNDGDEEDDEDRAESIDRVDSASPGPSTTLPVDLAVSPAVFHGDDDGNDNGDASAHHREHDDERTATSSEPHDANVAAHGGAAAVVEGQAALWIDSSGRVTARIPCTCASDGRPFYTQAMQRWCPLFWAALMSVGVLGQLLGHVGAATVADRPGAGAERRWACRPADVLMLAVAQMVVFSSVSHMASLSDLHAAALDLMLRAGAIDLAAHGDFLVAFAADRGCSEIIEMLVEYGGGTKGTIDVTAHGDLALRRALWRYVRLYRPAFGAGARLEPEERSSRMCLYAAVLVALASAAGLDTGGMDPTDALMEPLDPGFVRALARRVYPGMTANEIGRLRLPPLRPHYPPPFTPPL
ncbi:hypothetical protein pdul_cds_250 [Pandoravirus dulcis]|uniref:Ankyrin repeat domain containing protein n=1 Tax=Pandoravirus dulcis TaxID=1349409 RepID=S4VPL5_9VIRU|nr:hypothetical protein pdul_cds_250 [Pandoravirus dulcis]AGO82212.1 hypothetical protein pdul_cds_250 [Pandoravirus dulcis]